MGNLRIGVRLRLAFGLLLVLFLIGGIFSLLQVRALNAQVRTIVQIANVKSAAAEDMARQVYIGEIASQSMLIDSDAESAAAQVKAAENGKKWLIADLQTLNRMTADDPQGRTLITAIVDILKGRAHAEMESYIALVQAGKRDEATRWFITRSAPAMLDLQEAIKKFIDYQKTQNITLLSDGAEKYQRTLIMMVVGLIVCIVAATWVGMALSRSLRRELGAEPVEARDFVANVALGDLSRSLPKGAERDSLIDAIGIMQIELRKAVDSVRRHAASVANASMTIARGNDELSARTEQQASSLAETAASMCQMTEAVAQNAESAKQANQVAVAASEMADSGNEEVQRMVCTICEIKDRSNQISEITGIIEGIAFQTNILALNAAVEAARAGEAGRGFAVVASEVRSLAQRCGAAAKEIKELISASAETVRHGAEQADKVGATMVELKDAVRKVSNFVAEITVASEQQRQGIEQVSGAVTQMDQMTQQNVMLIERAATSSQQLDQEAADLEKAVAVFKLD